MDLSNLPDINIGNLASGLLGAAVGAIVVIVVDWRASRRTSKGSARALYYELRGNAALAEDAAKGDLIPGRRLSRSTWEQTQAVMGTFLSPADLDQVATAYFWSSAIARTLPALEASASDPRWAWTRRMATGSAEPGEPGELDLVGPDTAEGEPVDEATARAIERAVANFAYLDRVQGQMVEMGNVAGMFKIARDRVAVRVGLAAPPN